MATPTRLHASEHSSYEFRMAIQQPPSSSQGHRVLLREKYPTYRLSWDTLKAFLKKRFPGFSFEEQQMENDYFIFMVPEPLTSKDRLDLAAERERFHDHGHHERDVSPEELSPESSIFSTRSSGSSTRLTNFSEEEPLSAETELSQLLLNHESLKSIYPDGLLTSRFALDRLERKINRSLRHYAQDLEKEAVTSVQMTSAKFVRSHSRRIAQRIRHSFGANGDGKLTTLNDLEASGMPDKARALGQFIKSWKTRTQKAMGLGGNASSVQQQTITEYNLVADVPEEDDDGEGSDELSSLAQVKEFMVSGEAFRQLEQRLLEPQAKNDVFQIREEIEAETTTKSLFGKRKKMVRDEFLNQHYKSRRVVFVVDNSKSMRDYWYEATYLLETLLMKSQNMHTDGMDLVFTAGHKSMINSARVDDFRKAMSNANIIPRQGMIGDMTEALMQLFSEYLYESRRKVVSNPVGKTLTLYILTDGAWAKGALGRQSNDLIALLRDASTADPNAFKGLSVQLIQFAFDKDTNSTLERWEEAIEIASNGQLLVDIEPSFGDVYKMLLGSLVVQYDAVDNGDLGTELMLVSRSSSRGGFTHESVESVEDVPASQSYLRGPTSLSTDLGRTLVSVPEIISATPEPPQRSLGPGSLSLSKETVSDSDDSGLISEGSSSIEEPRSSFAKNRNKALRRDTTRLFNEPSPLQDLNIIPQIDHPRTYFNKLSCLKERIYRKSAFTYLKRKNATDGDKDEALLKEALSTELGHTHRSDISFIRSYFESITTQQHAKEQQVFLDLVKFQAIIYLVYENLLRLKGQKFIDSSISIFVVHSNRRNVANCVQIQDTEIRKLALQFIRTFSDTRRKARPQMIASSVMAGAAEIATMCKSLLDKVGLVIDNDLEPSDIIYTTVALLDLAVLVYVSAQNEDIGVFSTNADPADSVIQVSVPPTK